jgi:hypothetical protein
MMTGNTKRKHSIEWFFVIVLDNARTHCGMIDAVSTTMDISLELPRGLADVVQEPGGSCRLPPAESLRELCCQIADRERVRCQWFPLVGRSIMPGMSIILGHVIFKRRLIDHPKGLFGSITGTTLMRAGMFVTYLSLALDSQISAATSVLKLYLQRLSGQQQPVAAVPGLTPLL